jgi:hypothetical protein
MSFSRYRGLDSFDPSDVGRRPKVHPREEAQMPEDDFIEKYAPGHDHETANALRRMYQEVVEDLVATIREQWVQGWESSTQQILLGEAAIKGIWLAREFTRSGVGGHMQSVRQSKAQGEFESAIMAVAEHDRREREKAEKERSQQPSPPIDPLALKRQRMLLRATLKHRKPQG